MTFLLKLGELCYHVCAHRPEDDFQESVLLLPPEFPGIKLKSLGLAASTVTHSTILLAKNKNILELKK